MTGNSRRTAGGCYSGAENREYQRSAEPQGELGGDLEHRLQVSV